MPALTFFFGTLLSEDLTCIAAGLLWRQEKVGAAAAIAGCWMGIFLGDVGLWVIGRALGRRLLSWRFFRRAAPKIDQATAVVGRRLARSVLASRFLPGTRVPMYVALGISKAPLGGFVLWALLATAIWTPLLVAAAAAGGGALAMRLQVWLKSAAAASACALVIAFLAQRWIVRALDVKRLRSLRALGERLRRWEFWPAWAFYLPLIPWFAYLALRHRGPCVFTAANPGIPHGGLVGESKFEILSKLPQSSVIPSAHIPPGEARARADSLAALMAERAWSFPLVLKPDAGQRGSSVRLIRTLEEGARYLAEQPSAVLVQVYHPGPLEAGIFYVCRPGAARGAILSITDKFFPEIVGDGTSSAAELVLRHPRYRMQATTFLARLNERAGVILATGERMSLGMCGNHCQGALFRDGSHLATAALEEAIDKVARHFDGFFFGRFDVRYSDVEQFKRGRDLAIVELNGVTSESTNIYDPTWSLAGAYRVLLRQWQLLFEIGAENRRRGHQPSRLRDIIREMAAYYRRRTHLPSD